MSVAAAKFTLEQYERMVELGAFGHPFEMRVELLHGEIVQRSPIGPTHSDVVDWLVRWSYRSCEESKIHVRVQNPIRAPESDSEPEPDLAWVDPAPSYRQRHPNPSEVLLVIEVAQSSLPADRDEKLAAYAKSGIADYWIVNLIDKQVEVYRDPIEGDYQSKAVHAIGEAGPNPLAASGVTLDAAELFAEE